MPNEEEINRSNLDHSSWLSLLRQKLIQIKNELSILNGAYNTTGCDSWEDIQRSESFRLEEYQSLLEVSIEITLNDTKEKDIK